MSSAKGSGAGRTRAQAYQNKTTFRHNKGSKKTSKILATANSGGLCRRCADKIEWRIKYRKYKPLSVPGLCNGCKERTVKAAYRTLCQPCAKERKACPQCAEAKDSLTPKVPTKAEEAREYEFLEGVVETLRERDRRTVYRKVARGEDVLAPLVDDEDGSDSESDSESDSDDGAGGGAEDCAGEDCCPGIGRESDGGEGCRERRDSGEGDDAEGCTGADALASAGDGKNLPVVGAAAEPASLARDLSASLKL